MDAFDNEPAGRSSLAVPGSSRRTFLRMAGAVGVAAVAIPARSARAAVATHNFLGSYEGRPSGTTNQWFNQIAAVVPGLNGFRQYDSKPFRDSAGVWKNKLAKKWPTPPFPGYEGPSVFSIYPIPDTVVGVAPDAPAILAIKKLLSSAPPNSYLSAWHEFGNVKYPRFLTADSLKAVHKVMQRLVDGYPNVRYGPILFAPATKYEHSLEAAFRSVPRGMGFYGVDIYGNNGTSEGLKQLEKFIGLAKPLDPTGKRYPKLLVAETNTPHEKQRPEWFTAVCTRMHRYGSNSVGVLSYWNKTGKLSGPWLPHDKATINAMKTIIDSIF